MDCSQCSLGSPKNISRNGLRMDLIEIAKETGVLPIRIAQTNGGEFVSSCPRCGDGGKSNNSDRFHIWPNEKAKNCIGRYWCRQCEIHGDAIQFCRDFLGLSYTEAYSKLKIQVKYSQRNVVRDLTKFQRKFEEISKPNNSWQTKASIFVLWCHGILWKHPEALELLKARGFSEEAIIRWKLGNPSKNNRKNKYCKKRLYNRPGNSNDCLLISYQDITPG